MLNAKAEAYRATIRDLSDRLKRAWTLGLACGEIETLEKEIAKALAALRRMGLKAERRPGTTIDRSQASKAVD